MTLNPTLMSNLTRAYKAFTQEQDKIHADLFDLIDPAAPDSLQQLSVRRDLLTARLTGSEFDLDQVMQKLDIILSSRERYENSLPLKKA
ncbi:unnamed protein product [Nippostrongylus brasiliensis]|uniref:Tetratricopeptide repeat protein n=1 Tax=Nippostrongylus brasiliensis TaxID=27835 RepID=A0A0N4Y6G0_NIPBR|nr:unnamed protein product [Nippostrongylus brasiliensis]